MSLLSMRQAAEMLGYTEKGLRRIVSRSREKARGARTRGPTIKFFQTARGAHVKFRPEWIEEFIDENTVDPSTGIPLSRKLNKQRSRMSDVSDRDRELLGI